MRGAVPLPHKLHYIVNPITGCWEWTRYIAPNGYAKVRFAGEIWYVHRLIAELYIRPLQKGEDIHHTCECPHCVNPEHMEITRHGEHQCYHALIRWAK